MNKTRVFELKIEDDDELSGIDSISLVDEPAIEVNWIAFKKEKEHDFHIPDNEDDKYLEMLMKTAQNEQDLFDDGWVVDTIKILGNEEFATNPNGKSIEDEKEYRVRYKYILNPRITGQSAVIPTTRQFCSTLINQNFVWRVEDMEATRNDFGQSAMVWRGGYNCRHVWSRIEYKKDVTIINKASVNRGKVEVNGFPSGLKPDPRVMGYEEPSTITKRTKANPKPSTVRNLGLSKIVSHNEFESYSDYPDSVKNNAKAVLDYVEENGWGSCGTEVGKIRANQLAKGEPISEETIKRMYSYLSRHAGDLDSSKGYGDGCGKLMYDSWGGKTALNWAESKVKQFNKQKFIEGCPTATQDVATNLKNRQECIDVANYGPLNPNEPNEEYWKAKAKMFGGDVQSSKKALCGNCAFFVQTKSMLDCIASGINDVNEWDTIDAGDLGYCEAFDFKCASSRTCDAWVVGGPIVDEDLGYDNNLPSYVDELPKKKKDQKFAIIEDEKSKKIVLGPAMIPDQRIFRTDDKGEPYYVFFSPSTIRMIAEKYMRNKYTDNNDLMHDGQAVKDIHVLESWIVEDPEHDKAKKYGFDVPAGTWMISMKVNNPNVWEKIKEKKLNGFSVSGFFEEVAAFCREEMFLKQVVEILKNIKD